MSKEFFSIRLILPCSDFGTDIHCLRVSILVLVMMDIVYPKVVMKVYWIMEQIKIAALSDITRLKTSNSCLSPLLGQVSRSLRIQH